MTEQEFSHEYQRNYIRTVRLLRGKKSANAEDQAQEAWAKAWAKRHQFNGQAQFYTWVSTIAMNVWRQSFRPCKRSPDQEPQAGFKCSDHGRGVKHLESVIDARAVLRLLSVRETQDLADRHIMGESYEEIGRRRGCTGMAIKIRNTRAAQKIRAVVGK